MVGENYCKCLAAGLRRERDLSRQSDALYTFLKLHKATQLPVPIRECDTPRNDTAHVVLVERQQSGSFFF